MKCVCIHEPHCGKYKGAMFCNHGPVINHAQPAPTVRLHPTHGAFSLEWSGVNLLIVTVSYITKPAYFIGRSV
jgi:hypothetical protein